LHQLIVIHRYYYKHDPLRISTCPTTVHALLHIASSIREMGPVWAYWAFPMERFCGDILPNIRSRRYPYKSIDRYVSARAHLSQIKLLYNLHQELSLQSLPSGSNDFTLPWCKRNSSLAKVIAESSSQIQAICSRHPRKLQFSHMCSGSSLQPCLELDSRSPLLLYARSYQRSSKLQNMAGFANSMEVIICKRVSLLPLARIAGICLSFG